MKGQGSSLVLRNPRGSKFKKIILKNIRLLLCPIVQNFSSLSLLYSMVAMLFGTNLTLLKSVTFLDWVRLTLNLI